MADNTTLNPGTGGDVIASDDIGGVKFQRVKPAWGADGSAVDVSEANPLPVFDDAIARLLGLLLAYQDSPRGYDKSLQRQRGTVILESGTVTTVATVSSLSNIDGYNARMQVLGQNQTAWQACVRARIT